MPTSRLGMAMMQLHHLRPCHPSRRVLAMARLPSHMKLPFLSRNQDFRNIYIKPFIIYRYGGSHIELLDILCTVLEFELRPLEAKSGRFAGRDQEV